MEAICSPAGESILEYFLHAPMCLGGGKTVLISDYSNMIGWRVFDEIHTTNRGDHGCGQPSALVNEKYYTGLEGWHLEALESSSPKTCDSMGTPCGTTLRAC